jgi:hypothetical protein
VVLCQRARGVAELKSRAEATERVTCQAAAWLWSRRKCRVLAREVGLSYAGKITTAWGGQWRVDLAGCQHAGRGVFTYLVEVKGTLADLRRERIADGNRRDKWHRPEFGAGHELWIACGDIKTGWIAYGDVPEHWGVVVFDDQGRTTVLRKVAYEPGRFLPWDQAADQLLALCQVQTAATMPSAFNARRVADHGQPWERLLADGWAHEDRDWISDNKQMEMFDNVIEAHQEEPSRDRGDVRKRKNPGPRARVLDS